MKLLLLFEFFRQINQVKPVGRAGKGGVKPAVEDRKSVVEGKSV